MPTEAAPVVGSGEAVEPTFLVSCAAGVALGAGLMLPVWVLVLKP